MFSKIQTADLLEEWRELYPDKKIYGVPSAVFGYLHYRFPQRHCCHLFFGKDKNMDNSAEYVSMLPLMIEEDTLPDDNGASAIEWIYADDLIE